jgi:DNA-binding winged helix-turn-helix (wHTH) protein
MHRTVPALFSRPGTVVEDNNLTVQISALRRILYQGRADGSCIQTIAGRGYRVATVLSTALSRQ